MLRKLFAGVLAAAIMCGAGIVASAAEGDVEISEANFPDEAFREYVSEEFDTDGDGYLSADEISEITDMYCVEMEIRSLKGIEYFNGLTHLSCNDNKLTQLDLSANTSLRWLYCGGNELTELDVSANTSLKILMCHDNKLTEIDVSQNSELEELGCSDNSLTGIDVSKNESLRELTCYGNAITELDISNNPYLLTAYFEGEDLSKDSYIIYGYDSRILAYLAYDKSVKLVVDPNKVDDSPVPDNDDSSDSEHDRSNSGSTSEDSSKATEHSSANNENAPTGEKATAPLAVMALSAAVAVATSRRRKKA